MTVDTAPLNPPTIVEGYGEAGLSLLADGTAGIVMTLVFENVVATARA